MKNEHGLDCHYLSSKLEVFLRDISSFKPDEAARYLARLAKVSDEKVLSEPEFGLTFEKQEFTENQKSLALKCCIDITNDYEDYEIKKWAPPSVQQAWKIGDDYVSWRLKEDRKNRKKFTL